MASRISTAITHTINVQERRRAGYWPSSAQPAVVTKYVVKVSVGGGGHGGRGRGGSAMEWQVARRYSHFYANHAALTSMFSQLRLPRLPPKRLSMERLSSSPAPDPETVASRMVLLDAYLKALLAIPAVSACTQLRTFLGAFQGMEPWFELVQRPPRGLWRITPFDEAADADAGGDSDGDGASGWRAEGEDEVDDGAFAALSLSFIRPSASTSSEAGDSSAAPQLPPRDPPPIAFHMPYKPADARSAKAVIDDLGLAMSVDAFAAQFGSLDFAHDADGAAAMAQRFLNGMEAAVAVSYAIGEGTGTSSVRSSLSALGDGSSHAAHWDEASSALGCCTEPVLWCARDLLEDRLLHAIYAHTFEAGLSEEVRQDAQLSARLAALAPHVSPEQLDVSPAFCDTRFNRWEAAEAELRQMASRRTARAKMDCVMQCVLQLKQGLLECVSAQGAYASPLRPHSVALDAPSHPLGA